MSGAYKTSHDNIRVYAKSRCRSNWLSFNKIFTTYHTGVVYVLQKTLQKKINKNEDYDDDNDDDDVPSHYIRLEIYSVSQKTPFC